MGDFGRVDMRDVTLQSGLKSLSNTIESSASSRTGEAKGASFSDILKNSVKEVDTIQKDADLAVAELMTGKNKNIHETMISLEKADISFKLMMRVRNKILDAYKEVMRMNI